jgi:hypothetical protein
VNTANGGEIDTDGTYQLWTINQKKYEILRREANEQGS